VLDVKAPIARVRIKTSVTSNQMFLLVVLPDHKYFCKRGYELIVGLPAGPVNIYVGTDTIGDHATGKLTLDDLDRTEAAAKAAAADDDKRQGDHDALCHDFDSGAVPSGDLLHGLMRAMTCPRDGRSRSAVLRWAWRALDDGTTSPVPRAAILAEGCTHRMTYFEWRYCDEIAKQVDPAKVSAALPSNVPAGVRERILDGVRDAKKAIDAARSNMNDRGIGYPLEKKKFDDAWAVAQKFPSSPELRALVTEIEELVTKLDKGPGFAAGCVEKLKPRLDELVAAVKPKGDALLEPFKTTRGLLLAQALSVCYLKIDRDHRDRVLGIGMLQLLDGNVPLTGFHEVLWYALGGTGLYESTINLESQPLRRLAWGRPEHFGAFGGLEVASVKVGKDTAAIKFRPTLVIDRVPYDCDEGRITGVHYSTSGDAEVVRARNCKFRQQRHNTTHAPITIPAADAVKIAPGVHVGLSDSDVVWVKRGNDLVWVYGFSAK
jgi:hypothetical protein